MVEVIIQAKGKEIARAELTLTDISEAQEGTYFCRFKDNKSPSEESTVIVEGYNRRSRDIWMLLYSALKGIYVGRFFTDKKPKVVEIKEISPSGSTE